MGSDPRLAFEPSAVPHPGETVSEYLEFNGWSQRDLARRTGLTPKTISEICAGKAPITPPTSLAFEKVFRRPAHFWLNLQRKFDEVEARRRIADKSHQWSDWAERFPLAEMQRYGWLEPRDQGLSKIDALLTFLGVSSPASWDSVWQASRVAYRQTRKFQTSTEAVSAWVRAAELMAADLEVTEFDEKRLRSCLGALREQTRKTPNDFIPAVQSICASAGIAMVWVPQLSRAGISGCARWLTERKALIALTLQYGTDDQIWFTFFHEIAHILLHRKRHEFILDNAVEDLGDRIVDPEMQGEEEEANRFAADTLIPPDALSAFVKQNEFTNDSIKQLADTLSIGSGIVVGRLQREGLLKQFQGNKLKQRFRWRVANGKHHSR